MTSTRPSTSVQHPSPHAIADDHAGERATPFDALAEAYDQEFTESFIGRLMRQAVWRRLDARIKPGYRVLDLGCGTGEDAVHLAESGVFVTAIDTSVAMVAAARVKSERSGVIERIDIRVAAIENLTLSSYFDVVLSNFGALNCVEDLRPVSVRIAELLHPGGCAFLCLMGPVCLWEWVWYLCHGDPGKAFRRLRRGGLEWRGMRVNYPSIKTVARVFDPEFRLLRASAIGAFIPPSYVEDRAARHPRLLATLNRLERTFETVWPLPHLADHYLVELERR